jgi:hypothetical protein
MDHVHEFEKNVITRVQEVLHERKLNSPANSNLNPSVFLIGICLGVVASKFAALQLQV